jgi:hypothetical protein
VNLGNTSLIGNRRHNHRQPLPTIQKQLLQKQFKRERAIQREQPALSLSMMTEGESKMCGHGPNAAATRKLIDRILDRWPNHKKNAAQLRDYDADVRTLVERFGLDRVQAAVQEARIRKSFLPEPAELFELISPVPECAKPKPPEHDPNCHDCSGSGWKDVAGPVHRVTRCHCSATAVVPKSAFAPNIEPLHALLKQAVERMKTMDPAQGPDRKRHAELEKRIAKGAADKEARRERTKQDAAMRDIFRSVQSETGEGPELETVPIDGAS